MGSIMFTVPGRIGGKQRAGRRLHDGNVISFNPAQTARQERLIRDYAALEMRGLPLMTGPVKLSIAIRRTTPASWSRKQSAQASWVTGRPDLDNQLKLVADSLNGIVWKDDCQIAWLEMTRLYLKSDLAEEVRIEITELEDNT